MGGLIGLDQVVFFNRKGIAQFIGTQKLNIGCGQILREKIKI